MRHGSLRGPVESYLIINEGGVYITVSGGIAFLIYGTCMVGEGPLASRSMCLSEVFTVAFWMEKRVVRPFQTHTSAMIHKRWVSLG